MCPGATDRGGIEARLKRKEFRAFPVRRSRASHAALVFGQASAVFRKRLSARKHSSSSLFIAAEILELRIDREAIVHRREKRAIEREHERAAGASKSDIKKALHFLPAGERVCFFDFRFAIFLMQCGDYFVRARLANDRRITRRKSSDAASEKWNETASHSEPFAFCAVISWIAF